MLSGEFTWVGQPYYAFLVDDTYTPNFVTDSALSVIPSTAPLCLAQALGSLSLNNGAVDAANITLAGVDTTKTMYALVIIRYNSGNVEASRLICYIDQGQGFGVQPLASSVQLTFDTRGIFAP